MRPELKSDIQRKVDRHGWRTILYIVMTCFTITFNIYFAIFVWHPYDKAPNFAIGFTSLLLILLIIYNWRADNEELDIEKTKFINEKNQIKQ